MIFVLLKICCKMCLKTVLFCFIPDLANTEVPSLDQKERCSVPQYIMFLNS
jgi:hypothetical protein